jgi:predicted Zn-dependent peptidase
MTESIRKSVLPNGVRVVTESISHVASVAVGLWLAAGSRDETPHQAGLAHFLEHMLFKGTEKRPSSKEIADALENVGGYLNAFTDREMTCYHARTLADDLPLALDVLTDMYRNSLFDPEETARERKVVLEEIKRRDDDPEDIVHDLFAEALFDSHPLGLPVIGTATHVASFTPENLREFLAVNGGPENLIVAAAGNLDHERVVGIIEDALGDMAKAAPRKSLPTPMARTGSFLTPRPDEQVNFVLGGPGLTHSDESRYSAAILDVILGGSMGSRLFIEVRERRGLAYSVGTYQQLYREGGYWAAYGGTSPETFEECLEVIWGELDKIRRDGVTDEELRRAKTQFRSALIMGQESMNSRMMRIGKAEVTYDRVASLAEVSAKIDAVTQADVWEMAQRLLPTSRDGLTLAAIGPLEGAA